MSPLCAGPDPSLGIALRLSQFLDCQARVLGENGYLSFAGGPLGSGLLSASLTILVALVGYRFILGSRVALQDGVGWALRVGIALTLLGSWPAFQTVIYRVAIDGPPEVAEAILRPSGLPSAGLADRVQLAYDTMRLGSAPTSASAEAAGPRQRFQFQGAAPKSAVLFLVSTVGLLSAVRICIGFLLAIGPLPILSILLAGERGLFRGWIRVLAGAALATVGMTTVTAVELVLVESELARLQSFRTASTGELIDPQALSAIVFTSLIMCCVTLVAAVLVAARLEFGFAVGRATTSAGAALRTDPGVSAGDAGSQRRSQSGAPGVREQAFIRSLVTTARREQMLDGQGVKFSVRKGTEDRSPSMPTQPTHANGRRRMPRPVRSSLRREALR